MNKPMHYRRLPVLLHLVLLAVIFSIFGAGAFAQDETEPLDPVSQRILAAVGASQPATGVVASDRGNDGGGTIVVNWNLSVDDHDGGSVVGYTLQRALALDGPYEEVGSSVMGAAWGHGIEGIPVSGQDGDRSPGGVLGYIAAPLIDE